MDPCGGLPQPELHLVPVVERLVPERQPVDRQLARQKLLRQGRALVREVGLVAHQHQTPVKTRAAQGIDRLRGCLAAADDEDRGSHG